MSGTAWTKPEAGASWSELADALVTTPLQGAFLDERELLAVYELILQTTARLRRWERDEIRAITLSNLSLTGKPLTAEDVKRISEAR